MTAGETISRAPAPSPAPVGVVPSARAGALLGDAVVLVWNDVAKEGREQFYQWHDREHIPERMALPGFRRGRRYISRGHSPEWLTMYEADGLAALTSPEYLARLNEPTPWTLATLKHFRNTSRAVCRLACSTGASSGGHMLAIRIEVPAARVVALDLCVRDEIFPAALSITGVLACHLFESDQPASHLDTVESGTRAFDVPSGVLLCEATSVAAAEQARHLIEGDVLRRHEVFVRPGAAVYDLEICRLATR